MCLGKGKEKKIKRSRESLLFLVIIIILCSNYIGTRYSALNRLLPSCSVARVRREEAHLLGQDPPPGRAGEEEAAGPDRGARVDDLAHVDALVLGT